jgi:hypothetical protein
MLKHDTMKNTYNTICLIENQIACRKKAKSTKHKCKRTDAVLVFSLSPKA